MSALLVCSIGSSRTLAGNDDELRLLDAVDPSRELGLLGGGLKF